ncbi:MAG: hypothetical protein ACOVP4_12180 [Bacteriovoracaceae bacterium]
MFSRLIIYLREMFPISNFVGTLLTAVTIQLVALRLSGLPAHFSVMLILPAVSLTCFSLLIRVMDEFKDYEDDLKNFPGRPLPSGRVYKSDLHVLGWLTVVTALFFSCISMVTLKAALIVLFYSFLMLKWFFMEKTIRKSLPLALISHHPVVFLHFGYLLVSLGAWNASFNLEKGLLVMPLLFIFTNWELSRKIRMPSEETAYTTYSKIWGPRAAVIITLLFQVIVQATIYFIFDKMKTPLIFAGVYYFIYFVLMLPYLKFLFNLKLDSPLKKAAESQILFVVGSLLLTAFL